ncbi:MAG: hypothetical protein IGS38_06890 [Synechococcales cyanobacterium M58_A2018_015]|nr:hypothetical protein [Synechococcales cyanobacterium M58_A2018_015]
MPVQLCLLDWALADLFATVADSGTLTLADRYGLLAALLQESLTEEERMMVDRMLYAIWRGRITVLDELSVVQ